LSTPDTLAALRAQLAQFIEARFAGDLPNDLIREAVLAEPALVALPRSDLEAALAEILAVRHKPRLLVDWGELPQVGRTARPHFSLIATGMSGRPTVKVAVDRSLDNDPADPLRQVRTEEAGLWSFYVPFSLTTNGLDARPGLYVIDVAVTFPHVAAGQPRFLQARIRLNIPDASSGQRELVIDGDGQSVVNLAGHDLRSFSRVVLKGDDKSIINLQNFSQPQDPAAAPEKPVVFEYELKINRDIQGRLPKLTEVPQPSKTEAITLVSGNKRIHVFAKKRATFGRQRRPENDVCLRFLPRTAEHDEGSRAISRTHMALDLSDDGLVLVDEKSAKGVDVDCDPVKGERIFTYLDAHGGRHLDLPSPLSSSLSLEMELTIFGRDPADQDFRSDLEWDDVCFDTTGEQPSRLWQVAKGCGIESARVRRLNNLPDEEYVFLYRHATIGRAAKDSAIVVPHLPGSLAGDLRLLYAGRMFWLHSGGRANIVVDGERVTGACLIPLRFGQRLEIDFVPVHVVQVAQLQLDEDPQLAAPAPPAEGSPSLPAPAAPIPAGFAVPPPLPPVLALRSPGGPAGERIPPPLPGTSLQRGADQPPAASTPAPSGDPIRDALRSVAVIACRGGHGSGFVAAPGLLVTNYHVVADEAPENVEALFFDPATHAPTGYSVSLVAEDPQHDLAFLAIEPRVPPLAVRDRFTHKNGHRVVVIGSPGVGGNGERLENVVTDGRLGPIYADDASPRRWSLSTTLNPGNSGGPVLDADTGEVLGVTVAKFTTAEGLALAVPHDTLSKALERASAASADDVARAGSFHRQRYCLRRLAGFVAAADAAIQAFAAENDELDGELSSLSSDSLISRQGSGFATDFAAAIDGLRSELIPQLDHLRRDPLCRAVVRTDLELAFTELESLGDLLHGAGAGRALERAATTLREIESLCEGVRIEIEGSLQGGKSVYDAADAPSSGISLTIRAVAAAPAAGGIEQLRQWVAAPPTRARYLTKSRFVLACTCPTKLFYTNKSGEYANEWQSDATMESLAHEGNRVGALARLYFPGGVLVDTLQPEEALRRTNELLSRPDVTIFEAAIRHGDLFIRADILRKTPGGIELFEVKSKGYSDDDGDFTTASGIASAWLSYVRDVAFQKHVISKAFPGTFVQAFLFLPDKGRRAPSEGLAAKAAAAMDDPAVALGDEELAAPVLRAVSVDGVCDRVIHDRYSLGERSLSFEDFVAALAEHYREDRKFQAPLSPACLTCEFDASPFALAVGEKSGKRECWTHLLGWTAEDFEKPLAFDICGLSAARKKTLLEERRLHMAQVQQADIDPRDDGQPGLSLSQRQWMQVTKCVNEDGSSHLDRDNLRAEMASWRFPLHFIDFETCRSAIPFHAGSRPLDLVAFQFSHHVMHADGRVEHAGEFLCTQQGASPNAAFVAALREQIGGDDGAILHYAPHEVSTLRSLAGQIRSRQDEIGNSPELLAFINAIAPAGDREPTRQVIDLCRLVKRFYYAPRMGGSNSIKEVLPAILWESDFLRRKYSRPIYGAAGGIPSRNFSDMAWVDETDGRIRDPYLLLPPIGGGSPKAANGNGKYMKTLRNGGAAMQAYADLVLYDWSDDRRQAVQQALLRYCELDTLAMVFIVEAWREWCR
jgi:S1-C subfamily serine protease